MNNLMKLTAVGFVIAKRTIYDTITPTADVNTTEVTFSSCTYRWSTSV